MEARFNSLGDAEKGAVAEFAQAEYDSLVFQHPASHVSKNAEVDPEHWQQSLCELIASDPIQVREIMEADARRKPSTRGFTLIEISIVLVIIGLIVGGVLVGQDLIRAAGVRAQISQIEKYQTAVNTFYGKYGYLPGDINQAAVTQFGFTISPTRGGTLGFGDGNGELDGGTYAWNQAGETLWFWQDLSSNSHLIEGAFSADAGNVDTICASVTGCSQYFPFAKIRDGAFVYVYSGYANQCCSPATGFGPNFFGLGFITSTVNNGNAAPGAAPALTVSQAYNIDRKIDDGLPTTGNVLAQYITHSQGFVGWSAQNGAPTAATCYDTSSGSAAYSIATNAGAGVNCGISFRFQ